jgi:hypothetical protein
MWYPASASSDEETEEAESSIVDFSGRQHHLLSDSGARAAMVAADKPSHYSFAINRTFFPETTLVPVTLPFTEIVTRLNSLQPNRISGYPSMLFQLCFAADAGQLHVAPSAVICGAEPLLPEIRTALGRVDKLNPDTDAGKQYKGGETLDQLVVSGGDAA